MKKGKILAAIGVFFLSVAFLHGVQNYSWEKSIQLTVLGFCALLYKLAAWLHSKLRRHERVPSSPKESDDG